MNKYIHIYDFTQADFYIKRGITVIGTGTGAKGQPYVLFENNPTTKEVYSIWINIREYLKQSNK